MGPRAKKLEIAYSHCSFSWAEFTRFITSQNRREGLIWEVENKIQTHTHTHRERNKLTWSCSGWEKKNPSNRSMCVSFLGVRGHENGSGAPPRHTHTHPRASTCADICLKLSLLSSPAVPHFICLSALRFHTRRRGSEVLSHAVQLKSSFFFFFFLTLGKLLTEVWAALRRSSELKHTDWDV